METKTICILANSIKFSGRCIAGMLMEELSDGSWRLYQTWVRPLSNRNKGEINSLESQLNTRQQPAILDIVDIPLVARANIKGQPEDWLIQKNADWVYRGYLAPTILDRLAQEPEHLWLEFPYRTDRVSSDYLRAQKLPSLYLIQPSNLEIAIIESKDDSGHLKKKRRARFRYKGTFYDLALTDPLMQKRYFPDFPQTRVGKLENGPRSDSFLCVSLAPEFNGYHYKLVASIIEYKNE